MAEEGSDMISPPAVSYLRAEAGGAMERSLSQDIRDEREDLREAAEQTLNVIMDLGLDGIIRWVSPSWIDVIGTTIESVRGKPVADLVLGDNKTVFADVVESMKKDDSRSQIIRFTMQLGPASKLAPIATAEQHNGVLSAVTEVDCDEPGTLVLEGQGIMVYDHSSGGESHTMWMIRPWLAPREIKIDLPSIIAEVLGSGAEILASYLTTLAEAGVKDPAHHPPPLPILCRICERQIPPWWFEKHTELCLQEHKAELEVQICQEHLTEHRHAIVKVLDALEARKSRTLSAEIAAPGTPQAEYKGIPIGPSTTPSSGSSSGSPARTANRSRDHSGSGFGSPSGFGHNRAKSFTIKRPQARIVELLLDLCDTAIEINTPAIKETPPSQDNNEIRTQSPASEGRINQVMQWQTPTTSTVDQEHGLALLCSDSEKFARAKVDAVLRHRSILEYSERIRMELSIIVQDCVDDAVRRAARIAAGNLSDSEEDEGIPPPPAEEGFFHGSFDGTSSLAVALREAEMQRNHSDGQASSTAVSTGSNSPKECPTPRSNAGTLSILSQARDSRRGSLYFESDNNDSDGSMRSSSVISSVMSRPGRVDSPVSEFGDLRRAASSRQRHRQGAAIPGSSSPQRQESPSRITQPSSPLRILKPRGLVTAHDVTQSPATSPLLTHDFASPPNMPIMHRRQSSMAAFDITRNPPSPRLSSVTVPQARAVPPSIKDFEIIKPISKGAFGSVYLSKKKSTGDYFAIKVLKKADMVAKNQVTNVKAERAIMMWQGESDFVAKLYWTFSSKEYLYLVMEYLNGGDCASLIKVLGGLPEDWAKKYLGEVVLGVEHLHNRGIVHRDLKPDNLLIDQKGHLKLTDFGLSRMGLIGRQKRVLNAGTGELAPDLLQQGPFARSASVASSRSTSFDFHHHSPGSTPLMTPDLANVHGQPTYFSLNRDNSLSRESRRSTGHRSDSTGSDSLSGMFTSFSISDSQQLLNQRKSPIEELSESEANASHDLLSLQQTTSNGSNDPHKNINGNIDAQKNTPPQASMMPPPMALFDPDDSTRRFVGTPDYLAPETVNGIGQDERSDWWSVGCILFEFLYGYPPFHGETPDQVFENILARKISWPDDEDFEVSADAKDLMNKLLCMEPKDRLGANSEDKFSCGGEEIRNHAWFAGTNWETLLEDEAQFVPAPENPEDTEYFDARGATLHPFTEDLEDHQSPPATHPGPDYADRPHDALAKVRTQIHNNSLKRGLMPLHIPPHVRDSKSRRLSEPVIADDFGNFAFKNLPVLEKANKDVIQKLRAEAMAAQSKSTVSSPITPSGGFPPVPALEGSPVISMPLQRTISNAKAGNRSSSPSAFSQNNSSPSRVSQPSSPLLVSFVAGQNAEGRRKTSSTSSSLSHQSASSLQPGSFFDIPRMPPSLQKSVSTTAASSPVKSRVPPTPLTLVASPQKMPPPPKTTTPGRARSQTVGSQDGSPVTADLFSHRKRRSQVFDMSPSSSDNEGDKANALLRVQRRRQSSRRMSQITLLDGPVFRPLDVLICEDHPVSRMVMEKLLEKLRCRTITVSNGADAMRYAMSEVKFDIIMIEFKLPQINGADVARMIRETKHANSLTPIVAITGYLKELQAPHYFDALIEKPPTTSKLTEVMCRFCQWKAPLPGQVVSSSMAYPLPSSLRQESLRLEDSPTSGSSGSYARVPGSSFPGSSREDSIGSSLWEVESSESVATDDIPVIISRKATGEWGEEGGIGIGISEEAFLVPREPLKPVPQLLHQQSAPGQMEVIKIPIRQRSMEKMRAKRESIERHRHECADSGDDEDEELGNVAVREKSPKAAKAHRGSKLSTVMIRQSSRGSDVSGSENTIIEGETPTSVPEPTHVIETTGTSLTPPEIFTAPGERMGDYDPNETPKPRSVASQGSADEEPTPRPSSHQNVLEYLSAVETPTR